MSAAAPAPDPRLLRGWNALFAALSERCAAAGLTATGYPSRPIPSDDAAALCGTVLGPAAHERLAALDGDIRAAAAAYFDKAAFDAAWAHCAARDVSPLSSEYWTLGDMDAYAAVELPAAGVPVDLPPVPPPGSPLAASDGAVAEWLAAAGRAVLSLEYAPASWAVLTPVWQCQKSDDMETWTDCDGVRYHVVGQGPGTLKTGEAPQFAFASHADWLSHLADPSAAVLRGGYDANYHRWLPRGDDISAQRTALVPDRFRMSALFATTSYGDSFMANYAHSGETCEWGVGGPGARYVFFGALPGDILAHASPPGYTGASDASGGHSFEFDPFGSGLAPGWNTLGAVAAGTALEWPGGGFTGPADHESASHFRSYEFGGDTYVTEHSPYVVAGFVLDRLVYAPAFTSWETLAAAQPTQE